MSRSSSVLLLALALLPVAAGGSYGGGGPCKDFACHFLFWGLLLGAAWGLQTSAVIFVALHLVFCNPARSKLKQALLGGFAGVVAFELSAAGAALAANSGRVSPILAFAVVYLPLAAATVVYVRSRPAGPAQPVEHQPRSS